MVPRAPGGVSSHFRAQQPGRHHVLENVKALVDRAKVCHEAGGENRDMREALICLRWSVMTGCPCDTWPRESFDEFLLGLMIFYCS